MAKILKVVDGISDWSGKVVSYFLYAGIIVILCEVVLRYFFLAPTIWSYPIAQRIFATYFVIGGAYCVLHKAHIRVDIIYNSFSPRKRTMVDVVDFVCLFLIIFVLLWHGSQYAWTSLSQLEVSLPPFDVAIYPVKLMIPLAGLLLLLQGLAECYRTYTTAITRRHHGV